MKLLILYAIPVFIGLIALEIWLDRARKIRLYEFKDTLACLAMGTGNVLIGASIAAAVFGLYTFAYEHRIVDLTPFAPFTWLLLFFAEDFCYYWFHRVHHESRIGWAGHVNHHSSTHYNLAVALRQSWTTPFTGILFWLPLALLGFHPLMIITQQAVSLIYQFWIHTQTVNRLGPLEWIFNTPSHHRVHHGSNPQYIDRNYAGILIIWDRLFGTFEAERETVIYGLTSNVNSFNPITIAFHEWTAMFGDLVRATTYRQRLAIVFRHPKWFGEQAESVSDKV